MDLSELHSAIILWSISGAVLTFTTPMEWLDWLFHGPQWRRVLTILFMGPLIWVGVFIANAVDPVMFEEDDDFEDDDAP